MYLAEAKATSRHAPSPVGPKGILTPAGSESVDFLKDSAHGRKALVLVRGHPGGLRGCPPIPPGARPTGRPEVHGREPPERRPSGHRTVPHPWARPVSHDL